MLLRKLYVLLFAGVLVFVPSSYSLAATFDRPLSIGSTGTDVSALQQFLLGKGLFAAAITGYFGPITSEAVAAFQRASGLDPVGIVGPQTRALLNSQTGGDVAVPTGTLTITRQLSLGVSGVDVTALQNFLIQQGFATFTPTGYFGPLTAAAVSAFQVANNLPAVGEVGPQTRAIISSLSAPASSGTSSESTGSGSVSGSSSSGSSRNRSGGGGGSTDDTPSTDTIAPNISSVGSSTTNTTATITWNTSEAAGSSVEYGLTTSYGFASSSAVLDTSHSVTITGLTAATTYHFRISSADAAGNATTTDDYTFRTSGVIDTTPPVISAINVATTSTTATVTWTTNEAASSTVNYGATSSYGSASTSQALVTSHTIMLTGLTASTTYHYRVGGADAAGNVSTSTDATFSTGTDYMFAVNGLRQLNKTGVVGSSYQYLGVMIQRRSPPWAATNLRFFMPSFYVKDDGSSPNETANPNEFWIEAVSVKVGATVYSYNLSDSEGYVDPTTPGIWTPDVVTGNGQSIPANSLMEIRYAIRLAPGGSLPTGIDRMTGTSEAMRGSTSASFESTVLSGGAITQNTTVNGFIYAPVYGVSKGWDSRPVFLLDGDSICYRTRPYSIDAPYGIAGHLEFALDEASSSQRMTYGNTCVAGSNPADQMNNNAQIMDKRLNALSMLPNAPFTNWLSNHNTNSLGGTYSTLSDFVTMQQNRITALKSRFNKPFAQTTMLPRSPSTDGYRTVNNQNPGTIDATNGLRIQINDELMANRWSGYVDYAINTYQDISAGTSTNRDKWAVNPFTTTLLNAYSGSGNSIDVVDSPEIGLGLVLDPLSGSGINRVVTAITAITGGYRLTTDGATNWTVSKATSTAVGGTYTADGPTATTGLHPNRVAARKIGLGVGLIGFKNLLWP